MAKVTTFPLIRRSPTRWQLEVARYERDANAECSATELAAADLACVLVCDDFTEVLAPPGWIYLKNVRHVAAFASADVKLLDNRISISPQGIVTAHGEHALETLTRLAGEQPGLDLSQIKAVGQ